MGLSEPAVLWCLPVAVLLVVLFELRLDGALPLRAARAGVRSLLLACLVLALGNAHTRSQDPVPPRLVVAVEHSALLDRAKEETFALLDRAVAAARHKGVAVTVLPYGRRVGAPSPADPKLRDAWPKPEAGRAQPAAALRSAAGAFGPHESGGTLLIASGHGAHAGLADAVAAQRAAGRRVAAFAVPAQALPVAPQVRVVALDAPRSPVGPVQVRAAVRAPVDAQVVLHVDGEEVERRRVGKDGKADQEVAFQPLSLPPGLHRIAVTVEATGSGFSSVPRERDVHVVAPPTLLGLADPDAVWVRALEAQQLRATWTRSAPEFDQHFRAGHPDAPAPRTTDVMIADAKLLAQLSVDAQQRIVAAVREGMGLVVSAGNDKKAWYALAATPIASVLPLEPLPEPTPEPVPEPEPTPEPEPEPDVDPPEKDEGPGHKTQRRPDEALPITMLLVIDKSQSMAPRDDRDEQSKFDMAIDGAERAALELSPSDRLGVMVFAEDAKVIIKPQSKAAAMTRIRHLLRHVKPDGRATNIFLALKTASKLMQEQLTAVKHVVLLTDGEQYPPGPIFSPVVAPMGAAGITLTTVGIGRGARMDQLRDIVRHAAGGLAIYAPTPEDVPTIILKDTKRVVKYREDTAEARGLLRDPNAKDPQKTPEPEPEPAPRPPREPTKTPPPPTPSPQPTFEPLRKVRNHEAVLGFERAAAPRVGAPRRAVRRPHAQVLLARRDDEPVLAAGRAGLGRTLAWTLPDDDPGIAAWPSAAGVLTQIVRSALTPQERFAYRPRIRVDQSDDGAVLDIRWQRGASGDGFDVTWVGPQGVQSLGRVAPGLTTERLALPAAPAGSLVRLRFTDETGQPALPPHTYRVAPEAIEPVPAGDQAALDAQIGPRPPDVTQFVDTLPWGEREERRPLVAWLLWAAVALLPLDVLLHRHRSTQ